MNKYSIHSLLNDIIGIDPAPKLSIEYPTRSRDLNVYVGCVHTFMAFTTPIDLVYVERGYGSLSKIYVN